MNRQFKNVVVLQDANDLAEHTANYIYRLAIETSKQELHIALSGGSTPLAIFKILAEKYHETFPIEKVHLWWGDDRCVPSSSNESNFGNAYRLWLKEVSYPEKNIHSIQGENNPTDEAKAYAELIQSTLPKVNGVPCFDFIMLGLGTDGHTASIFPHQIELMDVDVLCVPAVHPDSGQQRISFTGKLINNAKEVIFVAGGASKKGILNDLVLKNGCSKLYPSSLIYPLSGILKWFIDEDASVDFNQ